MNYTLLPNVIWNMLKDGEIDHNEFIILAFLFKWKAAPEKPLGYTYIGNGTGMVKSTVIKVIKKLEDKGYVLKQSHPVGEDGIQPPNTYELNGNISVEWKKDDGSAVEAPVPGEYRARCQGNTGAGVPRGQKKVNNKVNSKVKYQLNSRQQAGENIWLQDEEVISL